MAISRITSSDDLWKKVDLGPSLLLVFGKSLQLSDEGAALTQPRGV
jgi:hypothetical protein